jgi:hypothetical protein
MVACAHTWSQPGFSPRLAVLPSSCFQSWVTSRTCTSLLLFSLGLAPQLCLLVPCVRLQMKLDSIIGTSSGFIESLPPVVQRRLAYLKELQDQHDELEEEYNKELEALNQKYQELYGGVVVPWQLPEPCSQPSYAVRHAALCRQTCMCVSLAACSTSLPFTCPSVGSPVHPLSCSSAPLESPAAPVQALSASRSARWSWLSPAQPHPTIPVEQMDRKWLSPAQPHPNMPVVRIDRNHEGHHEDTIRMDRTRGTVPVVQIHRNTQDAVPAQIDRNTPVLPPLASARASRLPQLLSTLFFPAPKTRCTRRARKVAIGSPPSKNENKTKKQ